jgi:phage-related minor tail protein
MRKVVLSVLSAAAIGAAGLTAAPQQAQAAPWWVVPAIVGGAVVGVGVGAAAANSNAYANAYAYEPRGSIYVEPTGCRLVTQRIGGRLHRVQVCD